MAIKIWPAEPVAVPSLLVVTAVHVVDNVHILLPTYLQCPKTMPRCRRGELNYVSQRARD